MSWKEPRSSLALRRQSETAPRSPGIKAGRSYGNQQDQWSGQFHRHCGLSQSVPVAGRLSDSDSAQRSRAGQRNELDVAAGDGRPTARPVGGLVTRKRSWRAAKHTGASGRRCARIRPSGTGTRLHRRPPSPPRPHDDG